MADLRISELTPLAGAGLQGADVVPMTDVSASTTKKITAKDLVQYGVALIDPGSIPSDKFSVQLSDGTVTEAQLADSSVTALKLADNSSGTVRAGLPAAGSRVGQLTVNTDDDRLYVWGGGSWLPVKAAGSFNAVKGNTEGLIYVSATATGDEVTIVAAHAPTSGARQFLAGPTASAGAVQQRVITGQDLPLADNVDRGAVVVGGGLTVDENGKLSINNVVLAQSARSVATWNEYGLVTGGGPIQASDLPAASNSQLGAVIPGDSLSVDPATGMLDIANSIAPGTYTKVEVDRFGSVTGGLDLEADDLPQIPADKISGSTLNPTVIGDRSIEEIKLSDYSTCYIQEQRPTGDIHLGQFWLTPSTNQLRAYGRGSSGDIWINVGFGNLQAENLRWGGLIDANTSKITALTSIGVSENLSVNDPIPAPSDELSGMYFVVEKGGSNIDMLDVTGDTFTAGDWLLYVSAATGAVHINAAEGGGGGGGGGATRLADLLDVELDDPQENQFLQFNGRAGTWQNLNVIDGGSF